MLNFRRLQQGPSAWNAIEAKAMDALFTSCLKNSLYRRSTIKPAVSGKLDYRNYFIFKHLEPTWLKCFWECFASLYFTVVQLSQTAANRPASQATWKCSNQSQLNIGVPHQSRVRLVKGRSQVAQICSMLFFCTDSLIQPLKQVNACKELR